MALLLRVSVKRPEGDAAFTKITAIIGGVFLALTLFNAASGVYALAAAARVEKSNPAAISAPPADSSAGKRPNFYFFIFDEYARQDVLKKYTGYDNTPFLQGLERKKFNVSYSSSSTASLTEIATANLWQYSVKYTTMAEAQMGMNRPPLFDIFKKAGYKIYVLVPPVFVNRTFDKDLVDVELQSSSELTELSIAKTVLAQSFLAYLEKPKIEYERADRLSLLQQAAAIIGEPAERPKFMYFHLLCPHSPCVFDEKGDPVEYENMMINSYYTGQLRFVSKKINELADTILEKDPHAVVLLQSDHGARFFKGLHGKEAFACFNALYVSGQAVNIEGLSTINTLRLAMNHALGLKLEPVRNEP